MEKAAIFFKGSSVRFHILCKWTKRLKVKGQSILHIPLPGGRQRDENTTSTPTKTNMFTCWCSASGSAGRGSWRRRDNRQSKVWGAAQSLAPAMVTRRAHNRSSTQLWRVVGNVLQVCARIMFVCLQLSVFHGRTGDPLDQDVFDLSSTHTHIHTHMHAYIHPRWS